MNFCLHIKQAIPSLIYHTSQTCIVSQRRWAGHNKWSKIHRLKAVLDQEKSKRFAKLSREIMMSIRERKSADISTNPTLASALSKARALQMPKANIDNIMKKALGTDRNATAMESIVYEAKASGGVAMMISILTDNRNRTFPQLRLILSKNNGALADAGGCAWMFDRKGIVRFNKRSDTQTLDDILEDVIDWGAEDVQEGEDKEIELICPVVDMMNVKRSLESNQYAVNGVDISYIPNTKSPLTSELQISQFQKLLEMLEDHEDVMEVSHNAEFSEQTEESTV